MKQHTDSPIFKRLSESSDNAVYFPTKHVVTRWFNIINREIFDNRLSPFDRVTIRRLRGVWATTEEVTDTISGELISVNLDLQSRFPSFYEFLSALAHEMVHKCQVDDQGYSNHGPTFYAWVGKFNKHGLPLSKSS